MIKTINSSFMDKWSCILQHVSLKIKFHPIEHNLSCTYRQTQNLEEHDFLVIAWERGKYFLLCEEIKKQTHTLAPLLTEDPSGLFYTDLKQLKYFRFKIVTTLFNLLFWAFCRSFVSDKDSELIYLVIKTKRFNLQSTKKLRRQRPISPPYFSSSTQSLEGKSWFYREVFRKTVKFIHRHLLCSNYSSWQ